ncbi:MAG: hypothetical protein EHM24_30595, partial [Acidobacteria bacterium]
MSRNGPAVPSFQTRVRLKQPFPGALAAVPCRGDNAGGGAPGARQTPCGTASAPSGAARFVPTKARAGGRPMAFRVAVAAVVAALSVVVTTGRGRAAVDAQAVERPRLAVGPADDFDVTGSGEHAAWRQAEWTRMARREPDNHPYETRFKMLYSATGLYVLMEGSDRLLTATMSEDFADLWNEDVFEVFL